MQTILGSGGVIGTELAGALMQHTDRIRLVSRNPKRVHPGNELIRLAQLLHKLLVDSAERLSLGHGGLLTFSRQ